MYCSCLYFIIIILLDRIKVYLIHSNPLIFLNLLNSIELRIILKNTFQNFSIVCSVAILQQFLLKYKIQRCMNMKIRSNF